MPGLEEIVTRPCFLLGVMTGCTVTPYAMIVLARAIRKLYRADRPPSQ